MSDLRKAAQALDAWDDPAGMKDLCVAMDALRTALAMHQVSEFAQAQEQAEPVAWMDKHGNIDHGLDAILEPEGWKPLYTTPPQQQAEPSQWDKPSASFNEWWDSDYHDPANPFAEGSAAYWAWAGWKSAQRQWVGLTDEEVNRESAPIAQQMKLAFHAGMYVAQKILKEKNGLHKD